jgi:hypothetical protein
MFMRQTMSKSFLPILLGSASSILLSTVVLAQEPSPVSNVAGNWTMSLAGQNRTMTYTLIQKGTVLTGTLRGDRGNLPLTGTVTNDKKVTFTGKAWMASLNFTGTVEGKTMKGMVDLPMGRGRKAWTATQ